MKNKKIIITIFLTLSLLIIVPTISAQYNPTLTEEQQNQLKEYRATLEAELVQPIKDEIEMEGFVVDALKGLIDLLDQFANHTRTMYSPIDSPFNEMIAESSSEKHLRATANKYAVPGTYPIEIVQVAKPDILISETVNRDTEPEAAEFTVAGGDKEKTVKFKGGKILSLENTLKRYGEGLFTAAAIRKDKDNYILKLQSEITGKPNKLLFFGDITPLQQIGMLSGRIEEEIEVEVSEYDESEEEEEATSEEEEDASSDENIDQSLINANSVFNILSGELTRPEDNLASLNPMSKVELIMPEAYTMKPESFLELTISIKEYIKPEEETSPEEDDDETDKEEEKEEELDESEIGAGDKQDLEVPKVGTIEEPYTDPFLPDSKTEEEEESSPEEDETDKEKEKEEGNLIMELTNYESSISKSFTLKEEDIIIGETNELMYFLNDYFEDGEKIDKIILYNNLENITLDYSELRIYSNYTEPEEEEEPEEVFEDGNYLENCQNAILYYDGIEIEREKNEISDLIEGVTLTLRRPSDGEEIEIKIDHDYETLYKYMSDFLDYNNILATYIYNVTLYDKDKTEQELLSIYRGEGMTSEEYQEKKFFGEAYERLLNGERIIERIKTELRNTMMGIYETSYGLDINMITQIGVSNKDYEYSLSNPLLEIDEEEFLDIVKANESTFQAVKEFFYKDTDENNIVDDGLAYRVYELLEHYRERRVVPEEGVVYPGPIYAKIEIHNERIEQLKEDLEEAKEEVEEKVDELRQEFIEMNQAKAESESMGDMFGGGDDGSGSGG